MRTLWTSNEAAQACGGEAQGSWVANGISIDSRSLSPGELFIALTDRRDGHDFVSAAFEAGATAAMVSRRPEGLPRDSALLMVSDTEAALRRLALWRRQQMAGKVIAVTGSVGKTSTKDMLQTILQREGLTHAARGSFNNHWGVPLTLASMPRDTEFAIIEIGMNHPGEIAPLASLTRPHVGIITEIAPAHLAAFDGLETIAEEKADIFSGLEDSGIAVFYSGAPCMPILENRAQEVGADEIIRFGFEASDRYRLEDVRAVANGTVMKFQRDGWHQCVMLRSFGAHFARNALGAIAAAESVGADPDLAAIALRDWQPPTGRGDVAEISLHPDRPPVSLIDDSYNANPVSVEAAIDAMAMRCSTDRQSSGRSVVIMGDMLELGPAEDRLHAELATIPSIKKISVIHCVGPLMKHLHAQLKPDMRGEWRESADGLVAIMGQLLLPGDTVLVKGSKASRLALVVDAIRELHDDSVPLRG